MSETYLTLNDVLLKIYANKKTIPANEIRLSEEALKAIKLTVGDKIKIGNLEYKIAKFTKSVKKKSKLFGYVKDVVPIQNQISEDPAQKKFLVNVITKKDIPTLVACDFEHLMIGSDPEIALKSAAGKALTADRFVPDVHSETYQGTDYYADGFVAEIRPGASPCRALHANNIHRCLYQLYKEISAKDPNIKLNASSCFNVSKDELEKAGERARIFGCDPSITAYSDKADVQIDPRTIDGMKHRKRYAGGHLHLGEGRQYFRGYDSTKDYLHKNAETIIKLTDLFCGIPSVLLDRNKESKERRKLYGRAGEYRLPPHGIEYRVLSNFWLHHPAVAYFVFGAFKFAALLPHKNPETVIKSVINNVDWDLITEAINTNSKPKASLAWRKFVRPYLMRRPVDRAYRHDLNRTEIPLFEFIVEKGVETMWPNDLFTNWSVNKLQNVTQTNHIFTGWLYSLYTKMGKLHPDNELFNEYVAFCEKQKKKGFEMPKNYINGSGEWARR